MVKGLDIFRAHFQGYINRYVLIGGTACDIAMSGAGLEFRATKDLDIVLVVEALDADFVRAFWAFVRAGGYQIQEKSTGQKQFYRFQKPANEAYPFMLELFARQPDVLQVAAGSHLTPLPVEEDLSSLSAILMDDDYYRFILAGRKEVGGLPVVDAAHLVPLKARAWLDLTQREQAGEKIDSKAIKKHKNDVFLGGLLAHRSDGSYARHRFRRCIVPGTTRWHANEVVTALPRTRTACAVSYLRHSPRLRRLNHLADQARHRSPHRRPQSFPG